MGCAAVATGSACTSDVAVEPRGVPSGTDCDDGGESADRAPMWLNATRNPVTAVIMAATPVSIPGKVCHQFRPDDGFSGMRRQLYFCHGGPRDVMKRMGKAQTQP